MVSDAKVIKQSSWYKQAANTKIYYISCCCRGAMYSLGGKNGYWSLINGKYIEAFLPYDRFSTLARKHFEIARTTRKDIDVIMSTCAKKSKKLHAYYETLSKTSFATLSFAKVCGFLKKLNELNYDYWCDAYFCDIYDPDGDFLMKSLLEENDLELSQKELSILMKPNVANYVQEEKRALLELARLHKKKDPIQRKKLEKHTKKYFYIANSWESTRVLNVHDFLARIDTIADVDNELKLLNVDWEEKKKELQEKYELTNELMNVFYFFSQLFLLRDLRKEHTLITNHYYDQLFLRISALSGIAFEDMGVLRVEDVLDAHDRDSFGHLKKLVVERKSLLLELYHNGNTQIRNGGKAVALYNLLQKSYGSTKNLSGQGVSSGCAEGIVRVVLGETHFNKFNHGEILVAPMTRPEFLPLMKKASAIITDEGGITCHAAIVSRELGIPCIVGTQKATTRLKDGMFVSVDADKGAIKIMRHLKLLSVQNLVESELLRYDYIDRVLAEGLLNITAMAQKIEPTISQQMGKRVKITAISMAIRRYAQKNK